MKRACSTFLLVGLMSASAAFAQSNLTITPTQPQAGQEVKFSYLPGGSLEGIVKAPTAYVLKLGSGSPELQDIPLKKVKDAYTGSVKTDTSNAVLAFGFQADNKIDNNADSGYIVQLYNGEQVKKGAYSGSGDIVTRYGERRFEIKPDAAKAMAFYQKEMELFPEQKDKLMPTYLSVLIKTDKEKGAQAVQAEIEKSLKAGLTTEADYNRIAYLYNLAKLPQQQLFFSKLGKEKFTSNTPSLQEFYDRYQAEKEPAEKETVLNELNAAAAKDSNTQNYKSLIDAITTGVFNAYVKNKDWEGFKKFAAKVTDMPIKMRGYNSAAWKMQEDSSNISLAEQLSKQAVDYARAEYKNPKEARPKMLLADEWKQQREGTYGSYADTYAMALYRAGKYKQGLEYAKEASQTIGKGLDPDQNNTYALLAEKALPVKTYRPQLEKFVRDGKASNDIKEILKRTYIAEKKSDAGYNDYMAQLEKGAKLKMIEDLKKGVLNNPTPQFALNNLSGTNVNINDLKGKVVIVDFWATWCGPCKASFPAMQKMVNKYKDDPNVKFLFVNTWENADDKQKTVQEFITKTKYNFDVLMDNDSKVVAQFGVSGIPTKFVIGRDGNIKFKSVGFEGDEKLMDELEAMIEIAN